VPSYKKWLYLAGAGAGAGVCAGADFTGWLVLLPCNTELLPLLPRAAMIDSVMEVSMKMITPAVVAFESADCAPRGPKVLCVPPPPNAPARSAPLLLCNKMTTIKKIDTMRWIPNKK
jgi:hypothetical protein